jgi:NAD(P)-dependent dehydrogenase (short-subunit alcohol dehydrogenase family)
MKIEDCVAIITGGASGLGEACVCNMIEHGAKVTILDFAEDRGEKIAAELGDAVIFCRTDVTDEKSVQAAIDKTIDAFGAIHVTINCAGVATPAKVLGKEGPMPMDHFNRVVQINLMGTMNVIRLAAEKMVKTGVVGMTLPIAREFADYGIRIMTIAPGLFETPMLAGLPENAKEALNKMMPFPKRLGKPAEFAQLARSIIENPMLNGSVIRLDAALRMAEK